LISLRRTGIPNVLFFVLFADGLIKKISHGG
jgi:hypothetical protein